MKQYGKISGLLAAFTFIGLVFLAFSTDAFTTVVKDKAFSDDERTKPTVSFLHEEHNEAAGINDCNTCHHAWEDGEKLTDQDSVGMECSDCHFSPPDDTKMDLMRVYHDQCRSCHMEEKAGPILCGECHTGEQ